MQEHIMSEQPLRLHKLSELAKQNMFLCVLIQDILCYYTTLSDARTLLIVICDQESEMFL